MINIDSFRANNTYLFFSPNIFFIKSRYRAYAFSQSNPFCKVDKKQYIHSTINLKTGDLEVKACSDLMTTIISQWSPQSEQLAVRLNINIHTLKTQEQAAPLSQQSNYPLIPQYSQITTPVSINIQTHIQIKLQKKKQQHHPMNEYPQHAFLDLPISDPLIDVFPACKSNDQDLKYPISTNPLLLQSHIHKFAYSSLHFFGYSIDESHNQQQQTHTTTLEPSNSGSLRSSSDQVYSKRMCLRHPEDHKEKQQHCSKKNLKNTYAAKIAQLTHDKYIGQGDSQHEGSEEDEHESSKNPYHSSRYSSGGTPEDGKTDKLMKNRLSAQKSRRVKKQYMEVLELKVKELEEKLQKVTHQYERTLELMKNLCTSETLIKSYTSTREEMLGRLEKMVDSQVRPTDQELTAQIDNIRYRFGASGKERVSLLTYYFDEIFNIIVPDVQKYMIYTATMGKDIFSDPATSHPDDNSQIMNILNMSFKEKSRLRNTYQTSLLQEKEIFSNTAKEFFALKQKLQKQVQKLEYVFDELRKQISPQNMAKFIVYLNRNRYKPDILKVRSFWSEMVHEQMEHYHGSPAENIRKQFKVF